MMRRQFQDINPREHCCAPTVLSFLFKESYVDSCRRVIRAGGDHHAVSHEILEKILQEEFGIHRRQHYLREPLLHEWMRDKINGTWVVMVDNNRTQRTNTSHLMLIHRGEVFDNHTLLDWDFNDDKTARVCLAWQLDRTWTSDVVQGQKLEIWELEAIMRRAHENQ